MQPYLIPYLVAVDDILGFLEASARPVPVGRVVFYPATVGGAGDVCEGFVEAHHGAVPCFRCRGFLSCCDLSVSRVSWRLLTCTRRSCLLVAAVYFTHHECHHERVNAGDGSACGVSRDSDGGS